ncbi:MAG: hypothetical protein WC423_05295 [Vulcanimicrobiota bacterium]
MKDGRFSTIRFNEWICISAQHEKAISRLGRQVYQGYSKGLVTDFNSIELCRDIAQSFRDARELREELEEELERDALDGLNAEEAEKAHDVLELSQAQRAKRAIRLKFTKLMGRHSINRALSVHRDRVKELSRDLGQRALNCFPDEPVLKVRGHKSLCRLAVKLQEDADVKWKEITASKDKGSGLSFHTILFGFIGDFARFSRGTHYGKMLLKYFKYNEDEENQKLTQQYAGTKTAEALKAQLAEVEEPMLDVGREIDNMQQDFEGSLDDWSTTATTEGFQDQSRSQSFDFSPDAPQQQWTPEPETQWAPEPETQWAPESEVDWSPDAGAWSPDESSDDEFLEAVADIPDIAPAPPAPTSAPASPQLLRKRPEPEAESWHTEPEAEDWLSEETPPPPPSAPRVQQSPATPQIDQVAASLSSTSDSDDWGWGEELESDFEAPAASATGPAAPQPASWEETTGSPSTDFQAKPSGKKPPFVKAQSRETPVEDWSQESAAPVDDWGSQPAGNWDPVDGWKSTPAAPGSPPKVEEDYGWGGSEAPAAAATTPSAPPPPPPPPPTDFPEIDPTLDTMTIDVKKLAERLRAESGADDPLLKLLGDDEPGAEKTTDSGELGDNLLPEFLRDRSEEPASTADDAFIPALPSFLDSADAPNLEIVPFGSNPDKEDDDDEPFIPQMPDL